MINFEKIKKYFFASDEGESNLNQFMKKKQNRVGIIVLVVMILFFIIIHALSEKKQAINKKTTPSKIAVVDGVLSTDFTQKEELSALEQQQSQMDSLEGNLKKLNQDTEKNATDKKEEKKQLIDEINRIIEKKESDSNKINKTIHVNSDNQTAENISPVSSDSPVSNEDQTQFSSPVVESDSHQIETIQFHYGESTLNDTKNQFNSSNVQNASDVDPKDGSHLKTPRTYVPAGTFAKAVLLEGADANASVNGQSATSPILLRILSRGTLPNGHHSHLKGCFVLASIYGDISSERGEARLEKISCTRKDGTILERKVEGYLSFAGKEGVRGQPVMRNGKILAMAGMSGMLSGFGSALQQSTQTQSVSPLGATTTINPSQVWENGAYGGASTAMSQLAGYYIKRADQYHPIIEIGSGTVATVIFEDGFSLNDPEEDVEKTSDVNTTQNNNSVEMKNLLMQAQKMSNTQNNSPFSNTN